MPLEPERPLPKHPALAAKRPPNHFARKFG
jgi:hypothetical protein